MITFGILFGVYLMFGIVSNFFYSFIDFEKSISKYMIMLLAWPYFLYLGFTVLVSRWKSKYR